MRATLAPALEVEVRPPWPYRLPSHSSPDRLTTARGGTVTRLFASDGAPVVARARQRSDGSVTLRAEPAPEIDGRSGPSAGRDRLAAALASMRFCLGVDEDLAPFARALRGDRLLGPVLRARPWFRPRRHPTPWEALAWAITAQLIESSRAVAIQRRIVGRHGYAGGEGGALRDLPSAARMAALAPAELAALDLAPKRATAMRLAAREVAAGRVAFRDPPADRRRLLRIAEIGPWTVQCLELKGLGDPDALPAGDLAYLKLVGRLAGLGRRATIPEVEEWFAPYEPYRGLAGTLALTGLRAIAPGHSIPGRL